MDKSINLIIDPEFAEQIPPLQPEEFTQLERNILSAGKVKSPLTTWNRTILDGHNRWKIIQMHPELPFQIDEMEFSDRFAAMAWICHNQLGRRNLTKEQKRYLIGKQYEAEKASHGAADGFRGNQYTELVNGQNDHLPEFKTTRERIAAENGVTDSFVRRASDFAKGVDLAEEALPGTKKEILSGVIRPTAKFVSDLVRAKVPEDRRQIIEEYRDGRSRTEVSHHDCVEEADTENISDTGDASGTEEVEGSAEVDQPVTNVSIRQIEALAKTMEYSDGKANEDDVIYELDDALGSLIFRWNKCIEMNPEAASGSSYRRRRNELIKEGIAFLHNFKGG